MNFFESQNTARRNTGKLILLFSLAVLSLIIVTNLLFMLVFGFVGSGVDSISASQAVRFNLETFFWVGVAVSAIVLLGSLYKIAALSGGGARVAEMMNGRLLVQGTQDLQEKKILNVVEEMAIASGTPVPPVYLMEEPGINAFAAGFSPSDAVIGITRGAIQTLSRDQLQGVVAHEFSHILHGDMRINIRLIGVLHGIMVLGLIGYYLLRGGAYSRRSKDSGGIVFLGLGLVVIGFVGTFFGNLIKAAVSRQREFLADASAVQFTRNPDGIGGALMQIATHQQHSYLNNPNSAEISHALFEEGRVSPLSGLYATHPPLDRRIRAILPNWDGDYESGYKTSQATSHAPEQAAPRTAAENMSAILTGTILAGSSLFDQVGNPDSQNLKEANEVLARIPSSFLEAAHEPHGARALVYCLTLHGNDSIRQQQIELLSRQADDGVYEQLQRLLKDREGLEADFRLPLVSIALSSLRQLSENQYTLFKRNFNELILIDKKISLLEWSLQKIVFHHLDQVFKHSPISPFGKKNIKACAESIAILFSLLVQSSEQESISPEQAFEKGALDLGLDINIREAGSLGFEDFNNALDELASIKPLQKPALLKACLVCISADKKFAAIEIELLRAVAATLDCPMPPIKL